MINIKILKVNEFTTIPKQSSKEAVGFDLYSNFYAVALKEYEKSSPDQPFKDFLTSYAFTIPPHSCSAIPSGLIVELPEHVEMDIKSRSGLFLNQNILAQGTIDPDYRGEIKIMLYNLSENPFTLYHAQRVAQAVFRIVQNHPHLFTLVSSLNELSLTERDAQGFGSTGVS